MSENIIKTKTIGPGIADVEKDFILSEEAMSRLVFHAQIHSKGIRGKIIRQRRESKDDEWIPDKAIDIRSLGKNESIIYDLKTDAVSELYKAIQKLAKIIRDRGIEYGENEYAVFNPDDVIITDQNKKVYINKILEAGYDKSIWESLVETNPDLVTKLSYARIISEKKNALDEFYHHLTENKPESYWQKFFELNQWIFGYGLNYQFLHLINDQPIYSGANYTGEGAQKGDFLMCSTADIKFTVLVEIKTPDTRIVANDGHRNGAWKLGKELLWAVSQLQVNCDSWYRKGSETETARDELEGNDIYTYQPKGILVIGHTSQLDNREKRQTFEAFRRNIQNPEILTFDELYERAKFICSKKNSDVETKDQSDYDNEPVDDLSF